MESYPSRSDIRKPSRPRFGAACSVDSEPRRAQVRFLSTRFKRLTLPVAFSKLPVTYFSRLPPALSVDPAACL